MWLARSNLRCFTAAQAIVETCTAAAASFLRSNYIKEWHWPGVSTSPGPVMFATTRLLLCPYTEADLDDLMVLWSDPRVQSLTTTREPASNDEAFKKSLRAQMQKAVFGLIIRHRHTGAFMGQLVVHVPERRHRDGTYGICLLPKFWNCGYGTEATSFVVDYTFRWIGLQRLSLSVFASNERAIAVYEKVGFVIEGRKRACVWTNDRWEDVLNMGILRDEWIEKISLVEQ